MKSLSVFQMILLATFGALAISAILIFALLVSGAGGGGIGQVTIWGTLPSDAFAAVIRQVAENDRRVAGVQYVQKDPATYETELTNALASGGGPDIFLLRQDQATQSAGKINAIPYSFLSDLQFQDTFIEAAEPFLAEAGVLAIPLLADPLVMYWNRDILASAGYAKQPAFWHELNDMATKIVKRTDGGSIETAAVAFGEYRNVNHAKDILAMLIMQAGGTITTVDRTGSLVPSLAVRTAGVTAQPGESALRFYTEFADPSKADYSWNRSLPEARAAFAAGDLALYFGYASEYEFIRSANPNLNFAVAPVPQIRNSARTIAAAEVWGLAPSRMSKNPQNAVTIASLLASKDISKALSVATGLTSARRDVLSEPATGLEDLFQRQVIIAKSWRDPAPAETDEIFRDMIESVTSGSLRIGEALQRADEEMAQLIGE